MVQDIKEYMEVLRKELNDLMEDLDNCDRLKLLETSRALDKVICEYIRKEMKLKVRIY